MPKHGDRAPFPTERYSLPRHTETDDARKTLGAIFAALCIVAAACCVWKALPASTEGAAAPVNVSAAPFSPSTPPPAPPPVQRIVPSLTVTSQPISWAELTLMLRTGLTDGEIIAIIKGKQQAVPFIGSGEENALRELGAGGRLLDFLRTCPVAEAPVVASRVVVTAPALPRSTVPSGAAGVVPGVVLTMPVDYKNRDKQIRDLKAQIDAIDEQISQLRSHPNANPFLFGASYNGPGYRDGEESSLKKYLDQLDKRRNELRRQKWQLEGR